MNAYGSQFQDHFTSLFSLLRDGTVLSLTNTLTENGITSSTTLICEETRKIQTIIVKVFSEGEKTEEYTVRLSDTPMDVIQQYCGQRDTMLCLKTSSQILNNDKTLGSQGVTADSVLEGRNRKVC